MKTRTSAVLLTSLLASCSSSSGVLPYGPDTFIITSTARTTVQSQSGQTKKVVAEANNHCGEMGKTMMPDTMSSKSLSLYEGASATFVFRCLDPGDPDLRRPEMRATPNVRIEDAR